MRKLFLATCLLALAACEREPAVMAPTPATAAAPTVATATPATIAASGISLVEMSTGSATSLIIRLGASRLLFEYEPDASGVEVLTYRYHAGGRTFEQIKERIARGAVGLGDLDGDGTPEAVIVLQGDTTTRLRVHRLGADGGLLTSETPALDADLRPALVAGGLLAADGTALPLPAR